MKITGPVAVFLAAVFCGGMCVSASAQTTVSVAQYAKSCHEGKTVCLASIAAAIADAEKAIHFKPETQYVITLPAGTIDLSSEKGSGSKREGVFTIMGLRPTGIGGLTIAGAGKDKTTLISNNELVTIVGMDVSHIHFAGITFMRNAMTTTQGTVIASAPGQVTLRIPDGFPTPLELYEPIVGERGRRYLRAYDNSDPADPKLNINDDNKQISWGRAAEGKFVPPTGSGRDWTIYFSSTKVTIPASYTAKDQIVCVKSKSEEQAYSFTNIGSAPGTDITFDDVRWLDISRGVFRNVSNVHVTNSEILRRKMPGVQQPCLSSPGGGPQIGQPHDTYPVGGNLVDHFYAEGTGDDSLAIFHDTSVTSVVRNATIHASFARDILLDGSCHVKLEHNTITNCDPARAEPPELKGCVTNNKWQECPGGKQITQ